MASCLHVCLSHVSRWDGAVYALMLQCIRRETTRRVLRMSANEQDVDQSWEKPQDLSFMIVLSWCPLLFHNPAHSSSTSSLLCSLKNCRKVLYLLEVSTQPRFYRTRPYGVQQPEGAENMKVWQNRPALSSFLFLTASTTRWHVTPSCVCSQLLLAVSQFLIHQQRDGETF